jgi:hypothetical protein
LRASSSVFAFDGFMPFNPVAFPHAHRHPGIDIPFITGGFSQKTPVVNNQFIGIEFLHAFPWKLMVNWKWCGAQKKNEVILFLKDNLKIS